LGVVGGENAVGRVRQTPRQRIEASGLHVLPLPLRRTSFPLLGASRSGHLTQ
jgi:hypothetical protein